MNRIITTGLACAGLLALTACTDDTEPVDIADPEATTGAGDPTPTQGSTASAEDTTQADDTTDTNADTDTEADTDEPLEPAYDGFPYLSHFVELDDRLQMHYLDEGEGDPIVLLHGLPTQAYLWRNMIPTLQQYGRVIAPDMINFGRSDKTDPLTPTQHAERVEQFIEALDLEDITLVLQDWGGPFGFTYAAHHPDNIRALAFFETPPFAFEDMSIVPPGFVDNVLHPVTGRQSVIEDNFFIECFVLTPMCGGSLREWTDAEREVYRAPFLTPESREQLYLLPQHLPFLDTTGHPVLDPDGPGGEPAEPVPGIELFEFYTDYLTSTDTPKLFVYGQPGPSPLGDLILPEVDAMFPNLQTATVGSEEHPVLHFIQEDAPIELAETIGAFIGGL